MPSRLRPFSTDLLNDIAAIECIEKEHAFALFCKHDNTSHLQDLVSCSLPCQKQQTTADLVPEAYAEY